MTALRGLQRELAASSLTVELNTTGAATLTLPQDVTTALAGSVREALTNVVKHHLVEPFGWVDDEFVI